MYKPEDIDLLVVDDDDDFRGTVVRRFLRRGMHVEEAASAEAALELCERRQFDVAIFDMVMPGLSGLDLLEKVRQRNLEFEIILLTGQGTVETAVRAMKLGAYDFVTKPFPLAELEVVIQKAYERRQLNKENQQLRTLIRRSRSHWQMIGDCPAMQNVFRLIERAAPTENPILIQGDSGTGKELVAMALHENSARREKPIVTINCAALAETLLESELFGHEKGAFTGAAQSKPGLFELADGGTLFIDEIGEMPGSMQAKLLRVLEDGSMRRVGSLKARRINVRVLSATNRDLSLEVKEGRFREDLYYRINVLTIALPPLRERQGDIHLLVSHFLGPDWQIDAQAQKMLENYHWPGNVRQLINVIERAKILANDKIVRADDLPDDVAQRSAVAEPADLKNPDDLAAIERAKVLEVLRRENGNKTRTARILGVTRRSLYRLLEKYEINLPNGR